jgi:hypothetical protein
MAASTGNLQKKIWLDRIFILRGDKLPVMTWILSKFYHDAIMAFLLSDSLTSKIYFHCF